MGVVTITDSANALPLDDLLRLGIHVVPIHVNENGLSTPETEVDLAALHQRLVTATVLPTTSQPVPEEFAQVFGEVVEAGDDAIAVLISAKLSGTFQAADLGASLVRESHPSARIALVDSKSNSMQEGFAVLAAAECAASGGSLEECEAAALASVARSRFLFSPVSLEHLRHGGRLLGAASLVGSILRISPILTASDGSTGVAAVVRSQHKALMKMAALMRADVARCGLKRAVVQVIAEVDAAARFARELIEPIVGGPVPIVLVGAAVSIHVGPAVGLAYETIEPLR